MTQTHVRRQRRTTIPEEAVSWPPVTRPNAVAQSAAAFLERTAR